MEMLISIDWDFITGDTQGLLSCCGFCDKPVTSHVSRGKMRFAKEYRSERLNLIRRAKIYPGAPIYVAECHASIIEALQNIGGVWNIAHFDAHHDRWNPNYPLHCGNWVHYARDHKIHHHGTYSHCTPSAQRVMSLEFKAVFMCLSSPWTPKELDNHFFQLIDGLSKRANVVPNFIGHKARVLEGRWRKSHEISRNQEVKAG